MAIPALIEGRDLITLAPNGTGKKVAWALAMLQRLCVPMLPAAPGAPRGLVLVSDAQHAVAASQHLDALTRFVPIGHAVAGAGASRALRVGIEVLVATPQQALELKAQGLLSFEAVEFVVVDEAERIVGPQHRASLDALLPQLPDHRQTAMFASKAGADLGAIAQAMLVDAEAIRHATKRAKHRKGARLWIDAVPDLRPVRIDRSRGTEQ
jgi:ATP-dependent RNA helicase RhlE